MVSNERPVCRVCGGGLPLRVFGAPGRKAMVCSKECRVVFDRGRYKGKKEQHAAELAEKDLEIARLKAQLLFLQDELRARETALGPLQAVDGL